MADETASTEGTEETDEQARGFDPITSQEALDKIIQARVARERKRFEDYDDLKAKAVKLAEIEEAQKTEAQKQQEAFERVQRELADERSSRVRAEVAAAKGVPASLLSGGTQEELEASAEALIAFKGEQPKGPILPNQGKTPERTHNMTTADLFAEALGDAL